MRNEGKPELTVAFALVDTLPRGEYGADLLANEAMARRLVADEGVTLPPPYDRRPSVEEQLRGVELPPGDDENQWPTIDTLRRALRAGVAGARGGVDADVAPLNALVERWGIHRLLLHRAEGEGYEWVGRAATPGWGAALAAFTVPAVLDLHFSGRIRDVATCPARWCGKQFLQDARGRKARFCSTRCANWVRQSRRRHGTEDYFVVGSAASG